MSQKSSVPQAVSFVSQALKRDKLFLEVSDHSSGVGNQINLPRHDVERYVRVI